MGLMKNLSIGGGRSGGKAFMQCKWFFNKKVVTDAVDKASRRVLSKFGAYVRQAARRSIRKPRRMRLNEMPDAMRAKYEPTRDEHGRFMSQGRKGGTRLSISDRPFASSRPGEPPRNMTGRLKGSILFWYSRAERSVMVGPAKLHGGRDVPGILEHGGITKLKNGKLAVIAPRPFMGPALRKELPKLPGMWRNSVKTSA